MVISMLIQIKVKCYLMAEKFKLEENTQLKVRRYKKEILLNNKTPVIYYLWKKYVRMKLI